MSKIVIIRSVQIVVAAVKDYQIQVQIVIIIQSLTE